MQKCTVACMGPNIYDNCLANGQQLTFRCRPPPSRSPRPKGAILRACWPSQPPSYRGIEGMWINVQHCSTHSNLIPYDTHTQKANTHPQPHTLPRYVALTKHSIGYRQKHVEHTACSTAEHSAHVHTIPAVWAWPAVVSTCDPLHQQGSRPVKNIICTCNACTAISGEKKMHYTNCMVPS